MTLIVSHGTRLRSNFSLFHFFYYITIAFCTYARQQNGLLMNTHPLPLYFACLQSHGFLSIVDITMLSIILYSVVSHLKMKFGNLELVFVVKACHCTRPLTD